MPATATAEVVSREHDAATLTRLFNATFRSERTLLLPHADAWRDGSIHAPAGEPLYLPAGDECSWHRIIFAHGFFSSALHEVAHWCMAGKARRDRVDYGYWYRPDGRDALQQAEFERVEARPQALEWAFSRACRFNFQVSTDNISGVTPDRDGFRAKVSHELHRFLRCGFPSRAERFIKVLANSYGVEIRSIRHD